MFQNTVELTKITFIGVPIDPLMHYRPLRTRLDEATASEIANLTQGGNSIGVNSFTKVAGRVIAPTTQSMGAIKIPYGYDQRRYSVIMEFKVETPLQNSIEIITGYTGYDEITASGIIAPDMPIYINSHVIARQQTTIDKGIRRTAYTAGRDGARQVLTEILHTGADQMSDKIAGVPLRPMDALTNNQTTILNLGSNGRTFSDTRSLPPRAAVYCPSARDNAIGSRYLSKLAQGYKTAIVNNPGLVDDEEYGFGLETHGMYADAANAGEVMEGDLSSSLLFSKLKNMTEYGANRCVTWQELCTCWQYLADKRSNVLEIIRLSPSIPTTNVDTSQHWGGANPETSTAFLLCQAIPALMNDYLFAEFAFAMNNRTADGSIRIAILGEPKFMVPVADANARLASIECAIATDIAGQILSSGVGNFDVMMTCYIIGSNQLNISVNGGPSIPYSAPAYCDSTYSPLMGDTSETLVQLGRDMKKLIGNIFFANTPQTMNRLPNHQTNLPAVANIRPGVMDNDWDSAIVGDAYVDDDWANTGDGGF